MHIFSPISVFSSFNMCSMAESVNAQIHGYSTSCRTMTALHFDFFMIVMFGLHNDMLEKELAEEGCHPRRVLHPWYDFVWGFLIFCKLWWKKKCLLNVCWCYGGKSLPSSFLLSPTYELQSNYNKIRKQRYATQEKRLLSFCCTGFISYDIIWYHMYHMYHMIHTKIVTVPNPPRFFARRSLRRSRYRLQLPRLHSPTFCLSRV